MNTIKFIAVEYWDNNGNAEHNPTDEQWAIIESICKKLTEKYTTNEVCAIHPETIQKLMVGLRNGLLSILIEPASTCRCHAALVKLEELAEHETLMHNQGIPRPAANG